MTFKLGDTVRCVKGFEKPNEMSRYNMKLGDVATLIKAEDAPTTVCEWQTRHVWRIHEKEKDNHFAYWNDTAHDDSRHYELYCPQEEIIKEFNLSQRDHSNDV